MKRPEVGQFDKRRRIKILGEVEGRSNRIVHHMAERVARYNVRVQTHIPFSHHKIQVFHTPVDKFCEVLY
jgi:hypothetical protein